MADYIMELRKLIGSRPIIMCGANVVLLDKDNRILMHHRRDNDTWGLPGGVMELGESLEETAIREVQEEVGFICKNIKLFNVYSGKALYYKYQDGNEVYNVSATYIAKEYSGELVIDKDEGKDARFFSVEDMPHKISPPVRIIINEIIERFSDIVENY